MDFRPPQLLALDDPRWKGYRSGYTQQPIDISPVAAALSAGIADERLWVLVWEELHHHGLLGEAADAIVPYLAVFAARVAKPPWHVYGFPVIVELARYNSENPPLPGELESSYHWAFSELSRIAAQCAAATWDPDQVQCAAACLALSRGQRLLARAYLEFNKVNAAKFLADEIGYVPDERD